LAHDVNSNGHSTYFFYFKNTIVYTDKKENQIFSIYREIQSGAVAKPYIRKYFPIYSMRRPLVIYDFATAPL
jgi:hypothetical protein